MTYHSIECCDLGGPAMLPQRVVHEGRPLRLHDAALDAMTDFALVSPVIVSPDRPIDDALTDMKMAGVRALLVIRGQAVIGLITAYDILGEKPILALQGAALDDHGSHASLTAAEIMAPLSELPLLPLEALQDRSVGDLVATFTRHGDWQHLLVSEVVDGQRVIRGIFSRTQIERRLETRSLP